MERRWEFINDEFEKLVKRETQQVFKGKDVDIVLEKYNIIEDDESLRLEDVLTSYKADKQLCKLTKSISLISAVYKILELDTDDILETLDEELIIIKNNIENLGNKKIWILLWVLIQKKKIDNEMYSNEEIAQFYIDLFDSDYINIIEEFIGELGIIRSSIFFKDEYLYILEDVVVKYPKINVFRSFLMFVYWSTKNYKKYLPLINDFIDKAKFPGDNSYNEKLEFNLNLLSYRLIAHSKLNMTTKALNDINIIHSLLPDIDTLNKTDVYSEKPSRNKAYFAYYRQCIITSISINLKQNNNELLAKDLGFVEKYMSKEIFESWEDYYPEAVKYLQNNLK